jgi:hypothetical protein
MDELYEQLILHIPREDDDDDTQGHDIGVITEVEALVDHEHTSLPAYFRDWGTWPRSTTLLCWYCNLVPEGQPWFISLDWGKKSITPQSLYNTTTQTTDESMEPQTIEVQETHGVFHSPCCIESYLSEIKDPKIMDTNQEQARRILFQNIASRYNIPTTVFIDNLPKSPNPRDMVQYKGDNGIEPSEYRQKVRELFKQFIDMAAERCDQEPPIVI